MYTGLAAPLTYDGWMAASATSSEGEVRQYAIAARSDPDTLSVIVPVPDARNPDYS